MNRWQLSKDRVLAWSVTFLLAGLIVYIGSRSSIANVSSDGSQGIINKPAYEVSVRTPQNTGGSTANQISLNQQEERTKILNQEREFDKELELVFGQIKGIAKPLELKNFPSPIEGNGIRNVGNYYLDDYGNYIFHAGIDYALSEGTVIRATRGGNVVFAGPDAFLGQKVTLDCGEGWLVTYGGLDNLRVHEGEVVETQGALGQVGFYPGAEGESNQPQLHYEVWHDGQVQIPL